MVLVSRETNRSVGQNRESRNRHTYMVNWFSTWLPKLFIGERMEYFETIGAGTIVYTGTKNELWFILLNIYTYSKYRSKFKI